MITGLAERPHGPTANLHESHFTTEEVLSHFIDSIRSRCDLLRSSAEQAKKGEINVHHFANRVIKIANELCAEKREEGGGAR